MNNLEAIQKFSTIRWELSELSKRIRKVDEKFKERYYGKDIVFSLDTISYLCKHFAKAIDVINLNVKQIISELNDELNKERKVNNDR